MTGDRRPEEVYRDFNHVFYNIVKQIKEGRDVGEKEAARVEEEQEAVLDLGARAVLWVVGGPGSRKQQRVTAAVAEMNNWTVISTGAGVVVVL